MSSTRPAGFSPFYLSSRGVQWYRRENTDGTVDYAINDDVQQVLDYAKALRNHNDGWMSEKWGRRRAIIPPALEIKWLTEEGLEIYNPEHQDRLMKKLRDPDYAYLLTADYHH